MRCDLIIGRERLLIAGPDRVLQAIRERYGAFAAEVSAGRGRRAPINLTVRCDRNTFAPAYERPVEVSLRQDERGRIDFSGGARGWYEPEARRGAVDDATGLGPVDVLVRTALSIALPQSGGLLLHGAALPVGSEGGLALCGASGTGKSTAAAAFGAYCDEMLVLRPDADGVEIESTPYWGGRPLRRRCAGVIGLTRGGVPEHRRLRGAAAVRF